MAKISLTKYFPPTTTSVLNITESNRTSTQTTFNLKFDTNLGSSSSFVGTGVTYVATVTISASGMPTQSKNYTLKNSNSSWNGAGTHTTNSTSAFNIPSSVNSVQVSVTYKYSDEATTMSGSTTLTLTKLVSTLGNIGLISDVDSVTLNITKYDNNYTQKLNVYGRNDNTIDTTKLYATRDNVEDGNIFQFTQDELNNLYSLNTTSGAINVMFVLSTYSGDVKLGDYNSKASILIINANPIFTDFLYEDSNAKTKALTGDNSKIILGHSDLKVTIPDSYKAIPQKKATMLRYIVDETIIPYATGDYVVTSDITFQANKQYYAKWFDEGYLPLTEGDDYQVGDSVINWGYDVWEYSESIATTTLPNYNKTSINVSAEDSRGLSTKVTKTLNSIAYTEIVKGNQNISRASNIGTQVNIEFEGTFWNNTFGSVANDLQVSYRFKKTSDTTWTTGTFIGTIEKNGNNFSYNGGIRGDSADNGFDIDFSYDLELTVSDKLSSVQFNYQIIAGKPAIKIVGNKVIEVNGCNGILNYSKEEKQVGYLFDEPLYRKTITLTMSGTGATNIQLDFDPSYINMSKTLFKKKSGSNIYMYNGFYNRTDDNARAYYRNYDRTVNVQVSTNNSSDQWTIYLILEYIKN